MEPGTARPIIDEEDRVVGVADADGNVLDGRMRVHELVRSGAKLRIVKDLEMVPFSEPKTTPVDGE